VVSDGFEVDPEALHAFSTHLQELEDGVRKSASVVGGCVGDPGIFGIMCGQLYGAGASLHCNKAKDQLNTYADRLARYGDALDESIKEYEASDHEALNSISKVEV
jgi:hypothetical protein